LGRRLPDQHLDLTRRQPGDLLRVRLLGLLVGTESIDGRLREDPAEDGVCEDRLQETVETATLVQAEYVGILIAAATSDADTS
jgi:hypothetical protein